MKDQAPAHSELGASGMHRWRNCPGSVRLSREVPKASSTYADEGTEAHALAASILEARGLGKPEPDTFEYDEDMLDMVDVYVTHVMQMNTDGAVQLFEHRFDLSAIYPGCFGTADCVTYYPMQKLLVVTDLKCGAGIIVEVKDNDQLKYYALGCIVSLGWDVERVRLEICQPRTWVGEPVSAHEIFFSDLMEFADELKEAAARTKLEETQLAMGAWCRFCPAAAAGICPLLNAEVAKLPTATIRNYDIPPVDYVELSRMLKLAPVIKGMVAAWHEFAYAQAMKGVTIPGFKLVDKNGRRAWKNEGEASDTLFEETGVNIERTKRYFLSPAQVEALPANNFTRQKKDVKKIVGDLTTKPRAGFALVPENDERPRVKVIDAKAVFTSTEEIDVLS